MKTLSIICILTFWCFGATNEKTPIKKVRIDSTLEKTTDRTRIPQTPRSRVLPISKISETDAKDTVWRELDQRMNAMSLEQRKAEIEKLQKLIEIFKSDHSPQSSPRSSSSRASSPRGSIYKNLSPRSDAGSEARSESLKSILGDAPHNPHAKIDSSELFADKETLQYIKEQEQLIGDKGVFSSLCKLRTLVDSGANKDTIDSELENFSEKCKECFMYQPIKLSTKIVDLMNETHDVSLELEEVEAYKSSIQFIRETFSKSEELRYEISGFINDIDNFDNILAALHKKSILETFFLIKNICRKDLDRYETEFKKILADAITEAEKYKDELSRDQKIEAIQYFIDFMTKLRDGESAILAESTSQVPGSTERGRSISRQFSDSGSEYYTDHSDSPRGSASIGSSPANARFVRARTL